MTKKVVKKSFLCLFPLTKKKPASDVLSNMNDVLSAAKPGRAVACEVNLPGRTSDWQAHHDFLESEGWGCGLFGAALDKQIEEIALRAVELAKESGDKERIAKSYRHLFYFYCEFNHPDSLTVGHKSVIAAVHAYGAATPEVGEEVAMLGNVHEFSGKFDQAITARDATIKIFRKSGSNERLFEALESAICSASDMGRADKVEEYARSGMQLVIQRCKKGSAEYNTNMEYFEEVLATANDPPVPIEEQQRQLMAAFPNLKQAIENRINSIANSAVKP